VATNVGTVVTYFPGLIRNVLAWSGYGNVLVRQTVKGCVRLRVLLGGRGGRGGFSESQQRNKGVLVESQGKRTTFGDDSD